MVKVRQPLGSASASGTIGKVLTYSHRKSGRQVRSYNKPLGPPSAKQRGQRRLTEFLVAQWQNMSDGTKATWAANAKAAGVNLPGYQYFMREAQRDLYTHHGLCLYSHCNEYVDGIIKDLSGNGFDGTPGPSYPANVPTLVNARTSKFGRALEFDGVDEYATYGNQAKLNLGVGDFTIIFEVMILEDQDGKTIIRKTGYAEDFDGWIFLIATTPQIKFYVGNGAASDNAIADNLPTDTWLQVIGRRLGTAGSLKIDLVTKDSWDETVKNCDSGQDLFIGAASAGSSFAKIKLDEICIYNRGLSDAELATRFKFSNREVS